jgi:CRISPR-associated endoribonuclease Cas6
MELQIHLAIIEGNRIPINYQYQISAWIYQVIDKSQENTHYQQPFKMFTFGQLDMRPYVLQGDQVLLQGKLLSIKIRLSVDPILIDNIIETFGKSTVVLGNTIMSVHEIYLVPTPTLRTTQRYTCLSPICVTRKRADYSIEYLSPNHADYKKYLIQNLKRKADSLISPLESAAPALPYYEIKILTAPRKKGVHLKNNTSNKLQVIGYMFDFELSTSLEFHELGYDSGFGEKNNMGFGCVDVIY